MTFSSGSPEHDLVNEWLQNLEPLTGLRLRLDREGICAIGHSCGLDCAVEVPDGAGLVYLRVPLLLWNGSQPAGLAEHCLTEHFLGLRTQGASFAIDEREGELVIWIARALCTLDAAQFGSQLLEFFDTARHWQELLLAYGGERRISLREADTEGMLLFGLA